MAKTKHQIRSEETYNKFIETLTKMITDEDINKINIRDLCNKIGLSPRTFYLYFPSKEAAILQCAIESQSKAFSGESLPQQPYQRLLAIFLKYYQMAADSPKRARTIFTCKLKVYNEELYSDKLQIFRFAADAIEQCQREHIIKNCYTASDIAWDLITFVRGIQMDYFVHGESYDLVEVGMEKLKKYLTLYTIVQ